MGVTNNLDSEIGRRLRQARLAENLTQDGLAQRLGISFQQVQKYENGTNRVSSSRLWAIGNALNIPVTYFFEELEQTDTAVGASFDDENTLPDRTIRVARMLNEMPDGDVKDKVFGLIKAFSKAS
jgi:transcriptional regulator with XRE-family HTH domain